MEYSIHIEIIEENKTEKFCRKIFKNRHVFTGGVVNKENQKNKRMFYF